LHFSLTFAETGFAIHFAAGRWIVESVTASAARINSTDGFGIGQTDLALANGFVASVDNDVRIVTDGRVN
jgi:hypothetical protein